MGKWVKNTTMLAVVGLLFAGLCACGKDNSGVNLIPNNNQEEKMVNLYAPMGKSSADADNVSMTAQEMTILLAEEKLGLRINFRSYLAEDYKDKTYDQVAVERVHSNMDDFYLLNPDVIQALGAEGKLADLSGLKNVENLRDVVKTANTVDGKLVAIPQEIVANGLFVNEDMFKRYKLKLPETPEDLLECCRVFKENGIETPIGANRWWLENFVFAQAYAELYNGGNTQAEIEALNNGEAKYSDYMRPGFEFLKQLIDLEYIDAKAAYTCEAIDGEGPDFLAQKTPIVMAYWSAANVDTAYGATDFSLKVIGFPSSLGPMPVVSMTGYGVGVDAENADDALDVMNVLISDEALKLYAEENNVISPSKNVKVECKDALKPLNDRVNEGIYVLGSNASMKVEQWGNTCMIVRELLNGASVEECLAEFDRLQEESLQ